MIVYILGHHGTSIDSAKEILKSNYRLSLGDEEWLGDGVYFFVPGVSNKTLDLAEKWAVAQAWDNSNKTYKYDKYCVMQAEIEVDDSSLLDLTTAEGVEIMNYIADRFSEKISSINRKLYFYDGFLLNLARNEGLIPLEVAKGNFYIKFAKERMHCIHLRTSNCTICAVYNPQKNITSNRTVKKGDIV